MAETDSTSSGGIPENIQGEDRPHKPADDREEIYFQGSPMVRAEIFRIIGWGIVAVALIAVIFVWSRFLPNHPLPWYVKLVLALLAAAALLIPVVLIRSIRYRISNYRIDFERGIFSRSIDTLELWHVEDISFHQSLLDRILGVGTVTIISHDETTPKLELTGLPHPRPIFETLKQRVIAVKRQRGVIKMDIG